MPRFGPSSPTFTSPSNGPDPSNAIVARRSLERNDQSVGLSCLSPDGRSIHCLASQRDGDVFVETRSLPLEGTTDESDNDRIMPTLIRSKLPQTIQAALAVDPPLELICVDGDASSSRNKLRTSDQPPQTLQDLPLLCLYTQKAAFLLNLGYEVSAPAGSSTPVEGQVISVTEPFESYLLSAPPSTCILRIRPAPQRRMGYATLCPPGSMAMLSNDYALVLCHGRRKNDRESAIVTTPLWFGQEELAEGENAITDFVFCQSDEQPLLASISILLLKASGAVLGASPVLFDGTVVPRLLVAKTLSYLEGELERLNDPTVPKFRQCKAAQQFMVDAFGHMGSSSINGSHFIEARVQSGTVVHSSTLWPIQIQGPIVSSSPADPDEYFCQAFGIEQFFAKGLVGMAIGRTGHGIDFAVLPPAILLPRFAYEDEDDRLALDGALHGTGIIVERVVVQPDKDDELKTRGRPILLQDPVVDSMLHYVTTEGVTTISTNVMSVISNKIARCLSNEPDSSSCGFLSPPNPKSKSAAEEVRTAAWSSLQVSPALPVSLSGTVISGDAQFGHVLITRLSNGSMEAVNMTESRLVHESSGFFGAITVEKQPGSRKAAVADEALKAMEATPPLYELVQPLMTKVTDGLSGIGRIVGGQTSPRDITPSELAMAIALKQRCDREVVLPLRQLNQFTDHRMVALKEMLRNQLVQIEDLKETVRVLQERKAATAEKLRVTEANAAILSQRSGSVLQASQNLVPTVSEAEIQYFAQLKRLDAKCMAWEETVKKLRESTSRVCDAKGPDRAVCAVDLKPEQIRQCHALLNGQELLLKNSWEQLHETKRRVSELATVAGVGVVLDAAAVQT